MITFGIVGNGFVGKATRILENPQSKCLVYDKDSELCYPIGTTMTDLVKKCQLIFICVPTPMEQDGSCYLGIVELVSKQLFTLMLNEKINIPIIVRSTVLPGTCDRLGTFFMPEFLTEKNYLEDFKNNKFWILGTIEPSNSHNSTNNLNNRTIEQHVDIIKQLFNHAKFYNKIKSDSVIVSKNSEAELAKYSRNSFLALKVSFCNEVYKYCDKKHIEYNNVRKLICLDSRITESHTQVPGHDGSFGYGGTCFPKDINALSYDMKKNELESPILSSSIYRNTKIDRKEKDWEKDKGRAVV